MKEDDYSTIVLSQGEKEEGAEGTEWRDGRRASVGLLRMDADNSSVNNKDGDDGEGGDGGDGEEDVPVVSKNGLSPIVFGICFGIVIYAVLLR